MPAATKGREGGSINIKHRKPCKQQARAVEFTLLHLSDARRTSGYLWFYGFACWAFGHNRPPSNGYDTVGQPWTALEKSKIDSISARWSRTVTYGQVVHINKIFRQNRKAMYKTVGSNKYDVLYFGQEESYCCL